MHTVYMHIRLKYLITVGPYTTNKCCSSVAFPHLRKAAKTIGNPCFSAMRPLGPRTEPDRAGQSL